MRWGGAFLCRGATGRREGARKQEVGEKNTMSLYKSCGFLGFSKPLATEQDWKDSGYEPDRFVTSCGFLGLQPKKATLYAIPEAWRDACTPLSRAKNATYAVTSPGDCAIQSCAAGTFKAAGRCVAPGTSCVPASPQPHASYTYSPAGDCALRSCAAGTAKRPAFGASPIGEAACPTGYAPIAKDKACQAAASHYGIGYAGTVHEPGLMAGCVVHGASGQPGKVAFNANAKGVDSGGDQFVVCARNDASSPCVKVGAPCGNASNYAWNAKGFCQGACGGLGQTCKAGERCCTSVCTPVGVQCADAAGLAKDAASLGAQIHALSGSMKQLSGSASALGNLSKL